MAEQHNSVRLLQLLSDGAFHSGVELAQALGISRAAVWKQIQVVRDALGLAIISHKAKGYRLSRALELLDDKKIASYLCADAGESIGPISLHFSIDSTNSWLMAQSETEAPSGSVCLAERQTRGRGRHGRTWVSPFGGNIYLSMLWRYAMPMSQLNGISIACGVAVAEALTEFGLSGHALKWPNDLLWRRRKLAGILMEAKGEINGPTSVVVGVGLNTGLDDRQAVEIDQAWASLEQIRDFGEDIRNRVAARLIAHLDRTFKEFPRTGLQPYLQRWADYDLYRGEQVCLKLADNAVCGDYLGLSADGGITILVNGEQCRYSVGEVQLMRPDT